MSEFVWLNGEIIPMSEARIGVEDRGFQFADGVYEVIRIYNGKPFTLDQHLARLERSAGGIQLSIPIDRKALAAGMAKLLECSGIKEGMIYLQLTRGVAERAHAFPDNAKPTLLFYARPLAPAMAPGTGEGVRLLSVADERWKRCWIKSIALLPNILAKNAALAAGMDEAVFIENGLVTECSASNLFAIIGRKLITAPVGSKVLPGITRMVLLELSPTLGLEPQERSLREEDAIRADELFVTSTTREISWVARWGDRYIGQAKCGEFTKKLHAILREKIIRETA